MLEPPKQLFPSSSLENLLAVFDIEKKPELLQKLKRQFNFDYYNSPEYIPVETGLAVFECIRREFYSDRDYESGVEELGTISLQAHFHGVSGYVNKIAIKLMSHERLPGMIVKNLKLRMPYANHVLEEERKGYLRYHQSGGVLPPAFTRGLLRAIFVAANAKNVRIVSEEFGSRNTIHEVFWEDD